MFRFSRTSSLLLFLPLAACYHATIETGASPSTTVIDKPWASSWVYGLVPPATVSTAAQCVGGVSRVETQHTFLNQLVGFLTLGIYTPMSIKVTCAGGPKVSLLDPQRATDGAPE